MRNLPSATRLLARYALVALALGALPGRASGQTVVSLTFDDGNADQYQAREVLAAHGMRATFYLISGSLGQPGFMTHGEALLLAADGHEIGGHTVGHADLPTVDDDEKRRQICNDRVALLGLGVPVTDFAYPYADSDAASERIVAECGYNSGRGVGGLNAPTTCFGCPFAETIPPSMPFQIASTDSNKSWTTLAEMKTAVTQAEANGGGWVIMVNHHVCDGCDPYSISRANLSAFLDWLQPRASRGTVVKTVQEVIGGPVQAPVSGPPPPVHQTGANLLVNPSLEAASGTGNVAPDCWQRAGFGNNTATWSRTSDAEAGSWAQSVAITAFTDGARRLVTRQDLGSCAPPATPGRSYALSGWYKSTLQPRFVAYYRTGAGGWVWWAQSELLPASPAWVKRSWTIPALPAGATALSVGLTIYGVGTLTVDDFSLADADVTPPAVSLTSPQDAATVSGIVNLVAAASDAGGLDHVEFLVNGSPVGAVSTPPYQMPWDSTEAQTAKVAIAARAYDVAGNIATSPSVEVLISNLPPPDTTPPAVEVRSPASGSALRGPVSLEASATDNIAVQHVEFLVNGQLFATAYAPPYLAAWDTDLETEGPTTIVARCFDTSGNSSFSAPVTTWIDRTPPTVAISEPVEGATISGLATFTASASDEHAVARVDFTVNGTLVATSTGAPWTVTWDTTATLGGPATLTATAYDLAGNARDSAPVAVTISTAGPDLTPPTTTMACDGGPCASGWVSHPVRVLLSAVDTGGAGVLETRYTTDGSEPTLANGLVYTGPFTLTGLSLVRYRSWDTQLNAEPTASQTVQVDVFPPATTATCGGAACGGWYAGPVQVTLTGSDLGGSGVGQTIYTTDGTTPAPGNGQVYAGPFTVAATATLTFRSWDAAGNAEAPRTVALRMDLVAPSSTVTCNGTTCDGWFNRPVAVAIAASDVGSGVASVRYTTDGSVPTPGSALYQAPVALTTVTTFRWRSWDAAGNAEPARSVTVQVDTVPPSSATVTAPANQAVVSGTVRFAGDAVDNTGIFRMRFFLDGRQLGTRIKLPMQWMWDTSGVAKGSHTLHVVADDLAGNQTASAPIQVVVQ